MPPYGPGSPLDNSAPRGPPATSTDIRVVRTGEAAPRIWLNVPPRTRLSPTTQDQPGHGTTVTRLRALALPNQESAAVKVTGD